MNRAQTATPAYRLFVFLFFVLYRFLVTPIVLTVALLIAPFHKKTALNLKLRRTLKTPTDLKRRPIWVHASSGEFEYAKPVIREFKARHPETPILVTYSSPSYAERIKNFGGVDYSLPLPLDLPGPAREFILKTKPLALLVARTDFWPEVLSNTHQYKIPTLAFSCTFRPLAGFRKTLSLYYQFLFNQLTEIYAVSEIDRKNIISTHTHSPVTRSGDTRYDQVIYRLQHPTAIKESLFHNNSLPTMVAGSTWPEDESPLLEATEEFLKNKQMRLVLAPHEPTEHHLHQLEQKIKKLGLTSERYSTANSFAAHILIIDKIGILAELYLKGQLAFVGGSFRSKVHSVMEPLAAGLPTFVGPHYTNNREAVEFQELSQSPSTNLKIVTCVRSGTEFKEKLGEQLRTLSPQTRELICKQISTKTRATEQVLQWLEKHINPEALT